MDTIHLPRDFHELLQLFGEERVRYLVVGGYAVNFHGHVRNTGDLDVWIEVSPDNAAGIVRALRRFGFSESLSPALFLDPNNVVQFGVPPLRVDILCSVSGVNFDACFPNRIPANVDGIEISIIDLDNLRKNKSASGRIKDLSDLDNLR